MPQDDLVLPGMTLRARRFHAETNRRGAQIRQQRRETFSAAEGVVHPMSGERISFWSTENDLVLDSDRRNQAVFLQPRQLRSQHRPRCEPSRFAGRKLRVPDHRPRPVSERKSRRRVKPHAQIAKPAEVRHQRTALWQRLRSGVQAKM